jgi:pSer/pThr/pTyr-binding forkhead associated (FHA) protein
MSHDPSKRPATLVESVEEIRAIVRRGQTMPMEAPVQPPFPSRNPAESHRQTLPATPAPQPAIALNDAEPFHPLRRPPVALLTILDDYEDKEGEVRRIRGSSCVIGRREGDVIIPHDDAISGRHAELVRRGNDPFASWTLRDLGSSNGTFVRISKSVLAPDQELLIGARRYRFETAPTADEEPPAPAYAGTRKLAAPRLGDDGGRRFPMLLALDDPAGERRFRLNEAEHWVGRDANLCTIVIDDPMLSPRHARIFRDSHGRWHVENNRSLNGLWFRVTELPIGRSCQFLCGEQRFSVKILTNPDAT